MKYAPRKILVPVDFSDFSEEALEIALDLGESVGADVLVLHVMEFPDRPGLLPAAVPVESRGATPEATMSPYYEEVEALRRNIEQRSMEMIDSLVDRFRSGARVETRILWGDPIDEILKSAAEEKADLIVMSTHGRTGLSRLLMGSVAERVVRHATAAVLVVRGEAKKGRGAGGEVPSPGQ